MITHFLRNFKPAFLVPRLLQVIAWPIAYIFLKIFLRYSISGIGNIKTALKLASHTQNGIIFASNHFSELDPIIITAGVAPRTFWAPMFYVLAPFKTFTDKKFGWRRHIYGPAFFQAWGAYPIKSGVKDYAVSLATHVKLIQQGQNMCIFPEGGLKNTGQAHGGVGYLAEATDAVIVPVHIEGLERITTREFFTRKRSLTVTYLPPIIPKKVLKEELPVPERYKDFARFILSKIYA